ncbi:MAG: hypothetical protein AAFQ80_20730 [Cyanobacteria bacterium J06621_8]
MDQKLPAKQMEFYKRIDEILYYKWDPIGIADGVLARDEYQEYLPKVFRLALDNDSSQPIAEYLGTIITVNIGLISCQAHNLAIAKLIMEVKIELNL